MYRNISVFKTVMDAMTPFRPDTVVIVVSNPVDILTSIAVELSGLPKSQVFGSGTLLDSVRLCGLLADKAKVGIPAPTGAPAETQLSPYGRNWLIVVGGCQFHSVVRVGRARRFPGGRVVVLNHQRHPAPHSPPDRHLST